MNRALRTLFALLIFGPLLTGFSAGSSTAAFTPYFSSTQQGEKSLDWILNSLYTSRGVALDRVDDDLDHRFQTQGGRAQAIARFAANVQNFGYNQGESGGAFHTIFRVPGSEAFSWVDIPSMESFRFFLNSSNGSPVYWASNPSENRGQDHLLTWRIASGPDTGDYVLAWEDMDLAYSDRDYNDLIVQIRTVTPIVPIPEPASIGLLALGILGAGVTCLRRRRF